MSDEKRSFSVVYENKKHLFKGTTPLSVSKKVITKLCKLYKKKEVKFELNETTKDSKKKKYGPYIGHMEDLKAKVCLVGGKKIRTLRQTPRNNSDSDSYNSSSNSNFELPEGSTYGLPEGYSSGEDNSDSENNSDAEGQKPWYPGKPNGLKRQYREQKKLYRNELKQKWIEFKKKPINSLNRHNLPLVREYEDEFPLTRNEERLYRPHRFNHNLRETNLYPTIREKLTKEWEEFIRKPINYLTPQDIQFLHHYIDEFGWFPNKDQEKKYSHFLRTNNLPNKDQEENDGYLKKKEQAKNIFSQIRKLEKQLESNPSKFKSIKQQIKKLKKELNSLPDNNFE
jgi:hypothetical protein